MDEIKQSHLAKDAVDQHPLGLAAFLSISINPLSLREVRHECGIALRYATQWHDVPFICHALQPALASERCLAVAKRPTHLYRWSTAALPCRILTGAFRVGVLNNHHGPSLNLPAQSPRWKNRNTEKWYLYGSYIGSIRLIRPTTLKFWLETTSMQSILKIELISWVHPWVYAFGRLDRPFLAAIWLRHRSTGRLSPKALPDEITELSTLRQDIFAAKNQCSSPQEPWRTPSYRPWISRDVQSLAWQCYGKRPIRLWNYTPVRSDKWRELSQDPRITWTFWDRGRQISYESKTLLPPIPKTAGPSIPGRPCPPAPVVCVTPAPGTPVQHRTNTHMTPRAWTCSGSLVARSTVWTGFI